LEEGKGGESFEPGYGVNELEEGGDSFNELKDENDIFDEFKDVNDNLDGVQKFEPGSVHKNEFVEF